MPANKKNIAPSGKKRMSESQEFEIMKLVLDKFLWLGFGVMAFGLYRIIFDVLEGIALMIVGIVVLLLFTWIIVKEYEIIK